MLWFYESLFPVVWIVFLLYWQIKAVGAKTTQRLEPLASRILRSLIFLIVILLLTVPRIPLSSCESLSGSPPKAFRSNQREERGTVTPGPAVASYLLFGPAGLARKEKPGGPLRPSRFFCDEDCSPEEIRT